MAGSLIQLIEQAITQYGERPAYGCMGRSMSFRELGLLSRMLARWLLSQPLQPDARIAVMLPNVFQNPVAITGILRSGMTVVTVNPLYTPRELAAQINDCGASVLIVLENFAHTVQQAQARYGLPTLQSVVVTELGDSLGVKGRLVNAVIRHVKRLIPAWHLQSSIAVHRWREVMHRGDDGADPAAPLTDMKSQVIARHAQDLAFLQYTGGTTGVPKGAMLSHGNLLANLEQCESWLTPQVLHQALAQQHRQFRGLTMVCALPLYHIFSLTACMLLGLKTGLKNLLLHNPRDLDSVVKALSHEPVHLFPGVNTLFHALLHHPAFDRMDFSQLQITVGGGMPVTRPVATEWQQRTGCTVLEGYGLSETSPVVAATPRDLKEFTGSVGLPMPDTQVRLLTTDGVMHDASEPDMSGEIVVRGPQVMRGYWNAEQETAEAFTAEGFFRTGDIGRFDAQGYLHILDRKKDMILVSGFNVYPNEVDAVVAECPGVLECAAVGVPDAITGESVRLFVVREPMSDLSVERVRDYCALHLTNYKRPKEIVLTQDLPKSAVGKILRRELRNR